MVSFCAKSTSAIFQFSRCKVPSQWLHGNCLCRDISIDIHILFLASGILLFSCAICFHTKSRLASALAFHTAQLFAFLHILVCDCQNAWTFFNLSEPGSKLQKSFNIWGALKKKGTLKMSESDHMAPWSALAKIYHLIFMIDDNTNLIVSSKWQNEDITKSGGGREGSKAVWNFSETSSVLVTPCVPQTPKKWERVRESAK